MFPNEPIHNSKSSFISSSTYRNCFTYNNQFPIIIATKASRVCYAAQGDPVFEFGLRRAQGPDAGTIWS